MLSCTRCSWMPAIVHIFENNDDIQRLKEKQLNNFYNCVTVAMSNQVVSRFTIKSLLLSCRRHKSSRSNRSRMFRQGSKGTFPQLYVSSTEVKLSLYQKKLMGIILQVRLLKSVSSRCIQMSRRPGFANWGYNYSPLRVKLKRFYTPLCLKITRIAVLVNQSAHGLHVLWVACMPSFRSALCIRLSHG